MCFADRLTSSPQGFRVTSCPNFGMSRRLQPREPVALHLVRSVEIIQLFPYHYTLQSDSEDWLQKI